jgi:RNA polymerase sigma-70 factor (ECF subfamily)
MSQTPERQLVQQLQAGSEDALIALHTRYANLVYSVAYRVLEDSMAAEEVTQDTFMRLWKKAYTYDPTKGQFVAWLLTVTRRLAIDRLRSRGRSIPQKGLLSIDEDPQLWENILTNGDQDMRRTLLAAVRDLPPDQRELIELAYFYGMTHTDIAETRGIPLGTVKTRIRLGLQKLRLAWGDDRRTNPTGED